MRLSLAVTLLALSLAACGESSAPSQESHNAHKEGTPSTEAIPRTPSPAGAKVWLIEPKDGAVVKNPITLKFGVEGMHVAPAGSDEPDSGHHHLLIDTTLTDPDAPIPADDKHKHFGKGQTEATIELPAGKHTLQDIFADKNHIPFEPSVQSAPITITVE